jgi:hypothetical protein
MTRILLTSLVILALLAACGGNDGPPEDGEGEPRATSTPDGALRAFCAAAKAKDVVKLGSLIAPNPGEKDLLTIRKGDCPPAMLDQLAEFLTLEEVGTVSVAEDGMTATVEAKLAARAETFTMVKVGDDWLVSDF